MSQEGWSFLCTLVANQLSSAELASIRLAGPDRGTGTRLYAMVAKVGIAIPSDLEPMSLTPRYYS